jgi:hypothetical protein
MDNWWFSGLAIFFYVCFFIVFIVAWAEIFIKAGYSRWLCFFMIIPLFNVFVFIWFAYSKWPIHELVGGDLRRILLEEKKIKIEKELKSLSEADSTKENKTSKQNQKLNELRQQYEQAKKLSEDYFFAAAKYPDKSSEKESNFNMGIKYRQEAEALEKKLENMQEY